jgi:phosphopantothenoylcysteine decarboxylase/phosphopantothenate--cysteine ligase
MKNISTLISLLGGTGKIASKLDVNPSAISNWKKQNKIPKKKQSAISKLSRELNINMDEYLYPDDLKKFKFSILLIICGGIASYKSLEIIRLLKQKNIELDVVMTTSAQQFITPLLVTSLNEKKCYTDLFSVDDESKMNHITLARKPDLILVAPATANIIGKYANGIADDLASTILLATFSSVFLAPSMNPVMWGNLATQDNYRKLLDRGVKFIEPEHGDMACGEFGTGRLPEPKLIVEEITNYLNYKKTSQNQFDNVSVVITAGPTIENIDPVRFISNRSSGKQGYAIASELSKRGANVTVISGPVDIPPPECRKLIKIESAREMHEKTISELPADIVICAAAVADWKLVPEINDNYNINVNQKIKKSNQDLKFTTIKNPDILKIISDSKQRPKIIIGFSAETENIIENAKSKLISKNLDLIIANDVSENKVFGKDTNKVYVLSADSCDEWCEKSKILVASNLADKINQMLSNT